MTNLKSILAVSVFASSLISCSDKSDPGSEIPVDRSANTQYVVMYSSGESGYLMQTDDITSGSLDGTRNTNNRQQVTGNRDYVPVGFDFLYNVNYAGRSSNGVATISKSWYLDAENNLAPRNDLNLAGDIRARTVWKDYIIGSTSTTVGDKAIERIKIVNAKSDLSVTNDGVVRTSPDEFELDRGLGENVSFYDMAAYGDYLLVALKTTQPNQITTQYEKNTFLGVYSYDGNSSGTLKGERLLTRNSTGNQVAGQIGGHAQSRRDTGIEPIDNGSIYVFSQALPSPTTDRQDYPPSAILRISGANIMNGMPVAFDEDYYVNLQQKADNHRLWRVYYMGGTKFCLQLYTEAGNNPKVVTRLRFAIYDVQTDDFKWVQGVPATISDVALPVLIEKDKSRVAFAINTTDQNPAIYTVDTNGLMTRGVEIRAEIIEGVARLDKIIN